MARLAVGGAESDIAAAVNPEGSAIAIGTVTRDTGTKRSGAASFKCDSTGSNTASRVSITVGVVAAKTFYVRAYYCFAQLPSATVTIMGSAGGAGGIQARLTSGGKLQLCHDNTQTGSDSAATISADGTTWYRVELKFVLDASAHPTDSELRLDGVTVATGATSSNAQANPSFGWVDAPGASKVLYMDDWCTNDGSGAANNTWPGAGNVIVMFPISDNARGNWTAGAGGTSSLFDAVNNPVPVGVADASATNTSQIKIKSTSLPSSCDLNLDTYTNAGVPTGATVNALAYWVCDGEDSGTGTKAGTAEIVSNPASGTVSFNFGDDAGAQGTYLTNWKWHTKLVDAPTVTLGTAPVVRVTCSSGSTGTRAASCCFMGLYVDYTPAVAATPSLIWQPAPPTVRSL